MLCIFFANSYLSGPIWLHYQEMTYSNKCTRFSPELYIKSGKNPFYPNLEDEIMLEVPSVNKYR